MVLASPVPGRYLILYLWYLIRVFSPVDRYLMPS